MNQDREGATTDIEMLNVVKNTLTCLGTTAIMLVENKFLSQAAEVTFDRCVVPTVTFTAHTAEHAMLFQQFLKIPGGIL
jgi:hypothetical protein